MSWVKAFVWQVNWRFTEVYEGMTLQEQRQARLRAVFLGDVWKGSQCQEEGSSGIRSIPALGPRPRLQ